jgi:Xaa-Pro aminopeptidase
VIAKRLARLRAVLSAQEADTALISHPGNRRYFSGFPAGDHAPDESSGLLVVSQSDARLFVSPTNLPFARATVQAPVVAVPWERPWPRNIGQAMRDAGARAVLFEDYALTVSDYNGILEAAPEFNMKPAGSAFHDLRAVKDDAELAAIQEAARITDSAFTAATTDLEPGITEKALAWRLDSLMREFGADGVAFGTCVATGPNGARPHHEPTDRPIAAGEPVVIDMGAVVHGYCADLTRTIILGDPPPEFTERYNIVLSAQRTALAGIRAGMSGRDADQLARAVIDEAGYAQQFFHGLGHGVGLLIHEGPSLGSRSEDRLVPGHVVSVEPGIYLDDWGGIRIEDLVVVTEEGVHVLSHAPKYGENEKHD